MHLLTHHLFLWSGTSKHLIVEHQLLSFVAIVSTWPALVVHACWLLTGFSYFSCCLLSCTTSNHLSFVPSSLFYGCFTLLGRKTRRMRRGGHHHRRHPQAPWGGTPMTADGQWGLLQEQRHLIGSCQWVSLAANPFTVALSLVFACTTDNFNVDCIFHAAPPMLSSIRLEKHEFRAPRGEQGEC
jgi:hypothetical protein